MVDKKRVMIGLSTGETLRKADFLPSFLSLKRPDNSMQMTVSGQSPAKSRNLIIDAAVENGCTHIFFIDDDMILPNDTLLKLLNHNLPIVSALYLLRTYPHNPAAFDAAYTNGMNKFISLNPNQKPELFKGTNAGLGACLISTEVFKVLEKPYVRLGEVEQDGWCDDVGFFNRARKAGFDIFIDLSLPVGHLITTQLWPEFSGTEWRTVYKHLEGAVAFPQHYPTEEKIKEQVSELKAELEVA